MNVVIPEEIARESLGAIASYIKNGKSDMITVAEAKFHLKRLQSYLPSGLKVRFSEDYKSEDGVIIKAGSVLDVIKLIEQDSMVVVADGRQVWILDDAKTELINEDEEEDTNTAADNPVDANAVVQ